MRIWERFLRLFPEKYLFERVENEKGIGYGVEIEGRNFMIFGLREIVSWIREKRLSLEYSGLTEYKEYEGYCFVAGSLDKWEVNKRIFSRLTDYIVFNNPGLVSRDFHKQGRKFLKNYKRNFFDLARARKR